MNLIEKLTQEELSAIKEYCMDYAGGPRSIQADPKYLLRFWKNEKENLFKIFGNELILAKTISYQKAKEEIYKDLNQYLFTKPFFQEFQRFLNCVSSISYADFLCLHSLISQQILYSNVYSRQTFTLNHQGQSITIQRGCKAIKALGKIANAFNLQGFEEFRLTHSQCLNQKTIKGTICLSIHPLDYMTMSDNACGWRSCMSWNSNGEYRQGTVEMMNSPVVVVAYLKSDSSTYPIGNLDWNSKKWRQLYIVSNEIITAIKQYPYDNADLSTFCLRWLRDLAQESGVYGPYHPQMCSIQPFEHNTISFLDTEIYVDIQPNGFMYDDYQFEAHDSFLSVDVEEHINIDYSGLSQCMCCGDRLDYDYDEEYASLLVCDSCSPINHCTYCNEIIRDDDCCHWVEDQAVCEYCYENYVNTCEKCGWATLNSYEVYLKYKDKLLMALSSISLCGYCHADNNVEWDPVHGVRFLDFDSIKDEDERKEILSLFDVSLEELEEIYNEN
jgi:hypothetical protein